MIEGALILIGGILCFIFPACGIPVAGSMGLLYAYAGIWAALVLIALVKSV